MSLDGVWKIEMLGAYGWEAMSTAFIDNGSFRAASQDHYSMGNYEVSGNKVKVLAVNVAYGDVRTLFGAKRKELNLVFEGEVDGDQIIGETTDSNSKYHVTFRATRIADLQ